MATSRSRFQEAYSKGIFEVNTQKAYSREKYSKRIFRKFEKKYSKGIFEQLKRNISRGKEPAKFTNTKAESCVGANKASNLLATY